MTKNISVFIVIGVSVVTYVIDRIFKGDPILEFAIVIFTIMVYAVHFAPRESIPQFEIDRLAKGHETREKL